MSTYLNRDTMKYEERFVPIDNTNYYPRLDTCIRVHVIHDFLTGSDYKSFSVIDLSHSRRKMSFHKAKYSLFINSLILNIKSGIIGFNSLTGCNLNEAEEMLNLYQLSLAC